MQLGLLPVVGLRHPESARVRPGVEPVRGVGGRHRHLVRGGLELYFRYTMSRMAAHLVSGPEPPIDVLGEEVWPVAALEVTQTTGGPKVCNVG